MSTNLSILAESDLHCTQRCCGLTDLLFCHIHTSVDSP